MSNTKEITPEQEKQVIEQAKIAYPFDDNNAKNHRIAYRNGMREVLSNPSKYGLSPAKDEQETVRWIAQDAFVAAREKKDGTWKYMFFMDFWKKREVKLVTPSSTVASEQAIREEAEKLFPVHPNEKDPITRHVQRAKQHGYIAALYCSPENQQS